MKLIIFLRKLFGYPEYPKVKLTSLSEEFDKVMAGQIGDDGELVLSKDEDGTLQMAIKHPKDFEGDEFNTLPEGVELGRHPTLAKAKCILVKPDVIMVRPNHNDMAIDLLIAIASFVKEHDECLIKVDCEYHKRILTILDIYEARKQETLSAQHCYDGLPLGRRIDVEPDSVFVTELPKEESK